MSFLETPRFPRPPTLGYRPKPRYSTTIIELGSGFEDRNQNWSRPLHDFECEIEHLEADVAEVLEWYHAMGADAVGFRFKDWLDYKSCRGHLTPAATDQPLVQITGLTYQLTKRYTIGARTQDRDIRKPVSSTILVADNGTPLTLGVGFTIDTATGIVTLAGTPTGPVTWGGEFDVPVRFEGDFAPELTFRDDADQFVVRVPFLLREIRV